MQIPFDFVFLRPWWLLLAPLGFVLAVVVTRGYSDSWKSVCDRELFVQLTRLSDRVSERIVQVSVVAAWMIAVIALAGPAWDKGKASLYQGVDAMVVVFDLSRSMNAIDLQPSRLERARYKALEVIEAQRDKSIGLVAFAGDAFDVAPISDDIATVVHLLHSLQIQMMPVQGSLASKGIIRALDLLEKSGYEKGSVVLVTDGIDDDAFAAAEKLKKNGYRLSVIAAGTADGAPIRMDDGDFLKDSTGNFIISSVDHESLSDLARAGGGRFALVDGPFSENLLQGFEFGGDSVELSNDESANASWNDRGPILLLFLLPLLALIFRRGWILSVMVFFPLGMQPAHALEWEDLWLRSDQQAATAIKHGSFSHPRLTEHPSWNGIGLYRQDKFTQAGANFSQGEDKVSKFNLGNALARGGELASAIEHYESALQMDPEFEDAQFNLDLVKKVLQQQQQRQRSQQNESRDGQEESGENTDQTKAEPEENPPSSARAQGHEQEQNEKAREQAEQLAQAEENSKDEHSQLMEQWLRAIPDDPAGLLRRRFYYEYQARGQVQRPVIAW